MSHELCTILDNGPVTSESSNATNMQPPIRFHRFHGVAIELSLDRSTAKLAEGYTYGGVFSNRPIQVNEKVCLRFAHVQTEYAPCPDISIGFTSLDPGFQVEQPIHSNQNQTDTRFWMEWFKSQNYEKDKLLYFYVNEEGELRYGIKGEGQRLSTQTVNTDGPLWAMIQLLGGLREVQFVDSEVLNEVRVPNQSQVENDYRHPNQSQVAVVVRYSKQSWVEEHIRYYINRHFKKAIRFSRHNCLEDRIRRYIQMWLHRQVLYSNANHRVFNSDQSQVRYGVRHPNHSQINDDLQVKITRSSQGPVKKSLPPSRYQNRLVPLNFHATKGRNIQFYNDSGVAARLDGELRQGYIFSAQPMRLGQTIVIQVLATEDISRGTVALGVTACDPTTLTPEELPDNAEYLLDRPEYWVVHPDAANGLRTGDELGVTLTQYGKLEVTKNNSSDTVTVLHVDHKINLWAFVDVSGPIRRVKLLISEEIVEPSLESFKNEEKAVLPSTSRGTLSECTICLENQVDSVIYKCGHMCMCYNCAVKQWKGVGRGFGRCPMCRGIITDNIRTYIP